MWLGISFWAIMRSAMHVLKSLRVHDVMHAPLRDALMVVFKQPDT